MIRVGINFRRRLRLAFSHHAAAGLLGGSGAALGGRRSLLGFRFVLPCLHMFAVHGTALHHAVLAAWAVVGASCDDQTGQNDRGEANGL